MSNILLKSGCKIPQLKYRELSYTEFITIKNSLSGKTTQLPQHNQHKSSTLKESCTVYRKYNYKQQLQDLKKKNSSVH